MRPVKPKQTRQMDSNGNNNNSKNVRTGRSFTKEAQSTSRGVSVDSPRMNSSGKIVFQSLERSSSSPSSFNGGPRFKHRGMERSYSANVRVTPVLNVPVCSLRGPYSSKSFGFGQLFSSPQKRETGSNSRGHSYYHNSSNSKNRTDRIWPEQYNFLFCLCYCLLSSFFWSKYRMTLVVNFVALVIKKQTDFRSCKYAGIFFSCCCC